jgi:enolase
MAKCTITGVKAREILDSRGNPTVEVDMRCGDCFARASVPSGASTGSHEALELRDGGDRFGGQGVRKAVKNVNSIIAKKITGMDVCNQENIDKLMMEMDGTPTKGKLGANAILGVSLAALRLSSSCEGTPLYKRVADIAGSKNVALPVPQLNVMNGGKHAGLEHDIQEFMLLPAKFGSFSEALRAGTEVYHALKGLLKKRCGAFGTHLGDEGGFVPPLKRPAERLELMELAINEAGYRGKVFLGLDCAASEFCENGMYKVGAETYKAEHLAIFYDDLLRLFPIVSVEDGMAEDDWMGWANMTNLLGRKVQIVGDDLLATNTERIRRAVKEGSCNALLLKINQIGTITESVEACRTAGKAGWNVVVSHRSGETEDPSIADIAVGLAGLGVNQIKTGAPARSERVAKYNQLLRIEEELGPKAEFAGKGIKWGR